MTSKVNLQNSPLAAIKEFCADCKAIRVCDTCPLHPFMDGHRPVRNNISEERREELRVKCGELRRQTLERQKAQKKG